MFSGAKPTTGEVCRTRHSLNQYPFLMEILFSSSLEPRGRIWLSILNTFLDYRPSEQLAAVSISAVPSNPSPTTSSFVTSHLQTTSHFNSWEREPDPCSCWLFNFNKCMIVIIKHASLGQMDDCVSLGQTDDCVSLGQMDDCVSLGQI